MTVAHLPPGCTQAEIDRRFGGGEHEVAPLPTCDVCCRPALETSTILGLRCCERCGHEYVADLLSGVHGEEARAEYLAAETAGAEPVLEHIRRRA